MKGEGGEHAVKIGDVGDGEFWKEMRREVCFPFRFVRAGLRNGFWDETVGRGYGG
jgi:hypothetical protein